MLLIWQAVLWGALMRSFEIDTDSVREAANNVRRATGNGGRVRVRGAADTGQPHLTEAIAAFAEDLSKSRESQVANAVNLASLLVETADLYESADTPDGTATVAAL